MTPRPVAVTLFCEDVREEAAGGTTIVGVMTDTLAVDKFPSSLPKFFAYTRMVIPVEIEISEITVALEFSVGTGPVQIIDTDVIQKDRENARSAGRQELGLIAVLSASPFPLPSPMTVRAITTLNGERLMTGVLQIEQGQQPV